CNISLDYVCILPNYTQVLQLNYIRSMKEYNLRKKAIKNINDQMKNSFSAIDEAKEQEMVKLIQFHQDNEFVR
ncbi:hypothetical protein, partial [Streptococcus sp. VTCC 12886]|uniref:hypothetical protein n=1 Tax=Streptococcus sp. VTCC 12886 TaxID=3413767 RepID=UPI003D9C6C5A